MHSSSAVFSSRIHLFLMAKFHNFFMWLPPPPPPCSPSISTPFFGCSKNYPLVLPLDFLSFLSIPAFQLHFKKYFFLLHMSSAIFLSRNIMTTITVDNPCYKKVDFFMYPNRLENFWFCFEAAVLSFAPTSRSTEGKKSPMSPSCEDVQAV